MGRYSDRVKLFVDMIKLEDEDSDGIDFYLCEKLLENFIEMNLIYKIINGCTMDDFHVCPCRVDDENNRLIFIIKVPTDKHITAISSFIKHSNNMIYYGRDKDVYEVNCDSDDSEMCIYFSRKKKDD